MTKCTSMILATTAVVLAGCGPYHNKYAETAAHGNLVSVEISYTGDFVYPQTLFFGEGETCSRPQDLQIEPHGSRRVVVEPGQMTSFMLGDLTPVTGGFSVGFCNLPFSFTPQMGRTYKVVRNRTKHQCSVTLTELSSSGARDITPTITRRQYSAPFWGGVGPHCKG